MAHAAPAIEPSRRPGRARSIDFRSPGVWLPAVLAVVYGLWAAEIRRNSIGHGITGWDVLFGVVTGVIVGVLCFALHRVSHRLPRELRAAAWAAFAGITFGYLYSLTDASILRSVGMALAVAVWVGLATFYRFYTTEK
ncbi:hypothetical protein ACFVT5_28115 [Streptomyces sp. NPDC058001]|uniref:hypothetical protein n=1 Tax=Streptomyces sp. NPDC058001 TaxID=3346300 RepID=UPI0036EC38C5